MNLLTLKSYEFIKFIGEYGLNPIPCTKSNYMEEVFSNRYHIQSSLLELESEFTKLMHEQVNLENCDSFRGRVAKCMEARLKIYEEMPHNGLLFAGNLLAYLNSLRNIEFCTTFFHNISDSILKCSGDIYIDESYYTKRLISGIIYRKALQDIAENGLTEDILIGTRRRIKKVGEFGKLKGEFKNIVKFLSSFRLH